MNIIYIIGTIQPGTEENAINKIMLLLKDEEQPILIYHGDSETAATLRTYAKGEKLKFLRDLDTDRDRLYSRMIAARTLIILDYPVADGMKAHRTRSAMTIEPKTAVILPNDNQPHPHENARILCTGKKSNRRPRRRLPR